MKKRFLRIAAMVALVLALSPSMVFAEETDYEYVAYENDNDVYDDAEPAEEAEEQPEIVWHPVLANVYSHQEFFFRVGGNFTISQVNERDEVWIVDMWHLRALIDADFDMWYFQGIDEAMSTNPQLEYLLDSWEWAASTFGVLDMPTMRLVTSAYTRIEFDFYAESLKVLSWGGEAQQDTEMVGDIIAPGASVTLPGAPSLTAVYFQVAYGPGNPVESGHVLLLIEVIGEDGRRAPTYSFNPQDHIPSEWAAQSISRSNELGILPEFMDRSLRRRISRLEFATLAVNIYETAMQREIAGRAQFNDTEDINAGKIGFLGVMTENEFGNFSPSNPVTREQAALLITRLASVMGTHLPAGDGNFNDAGQIQAWAREAVLQVTGAGIMSAPDGSFEPTRILTREETIVMMLRLFDRR